MISLPCPKSLPNSMPDKIEVRSDPGLDRIPARSQTSKRDMCRPGLDVQEIVFTESTRKQGTRDAGSKCVAKASANTISNHRQEEEITSPLRLALARRSVKKQIFKYMDQGDRKIDIEIRTGLSHQCIKWHRQLWRYEFCHPRPRSKKFSRSSSRTALSPSTRSERSSRKRPACDGEGDSSSADDSSSGKRRRKHCRVKQAKGRPLGAGPEVPDFSRGRCAEREMKGSDPFTGKENVPGKDEAMVISGEMKVLPIRDLSHRRSR